MFWYLDFCGSDSDGVLCVCPACWCMPCYFGEFCCCYSFAIFSSCVSFHIWLLPIVNSVPPWRIFIFDEPILLFVWPVCDGRIPSILFCSPDLWVTMFSILNVSLLRIFYSSGDPTQPKVSCVWTLVLCLAHVHKFVLWFLLCWFLLSLHTAPEAKIGCSEHFQRYFFDYARGRCIDSRYVSRSNQKIRLTEKITFF